MHLPSSFDGYTNPEVKWNPGWGDTGSSVGRAGRGSKENLFGEGTENEGERTEAAVAEILGEAAALNLLKFHFTKPHLSLTAVQIRVFLLLFFPI